MKFIKFFVPTLLAIALVFALNGELTIGDKNLPPVAPLLSPFTGFWQNAESKAIDWKTDVQLDGLTGKVTVQYDDRRVPHVFAENDEDLYYMQGYLTAQDRLWQMEFITIVASGRVSEIIGERTLLLDRTQRRMGIAYAAEQAVAKINESPTSKMVLEQYAAGVNAYINTLNDGSLPLEYKLLNYKPELWSPYKTTLLLKYMSNSLSGWDKDFEYTNAYNLFGKEVVDLLYPDRSPGINPIIPEGTSYDFHVTPIDTPKYSVANGVFISSEYDGPIRENLGSNNWAVSGSRTNTGFPMLASDPHLALNLPAIWYEMQLHSPNVNVYGATLPGSPCVIIGFNEDAAWGVTNAGMDVRDWFVTELLPNDKYKHDGVEKSITYRYDTIKIKDGADFIDTIRFTHIGPVVYDERFTQNGNTTPLALRWTAHDPSDELMTFYTLNRAATHDDYLKALNYYYCPGQNFVFANHAGDIAMRQQGHFPKKWPEQGRFIMDGTTSDFEWQGFIPFDQNPQVKNPPRGWVSSANQHPTDSTYPYYYCGYYEYDRSRRINELLGVDRLYTVEDMKQFQNDNYAYFAKDLLPFLMENVNDLNLNPGQKEVWDLLKNWDYMYTADSKAATAFEMIYDTLMVMVWDELQPYDEKGLIAPTGYTTVQVMKTHPNHPLMDYKGTPEIEDASDLLNMAFLAGVEKYQDWKAANGKEPEWWMYKNTTVLHMARIAPLSRPMIKMGGNRHILNATDGTHGASWRMVVSLEDEVKAWGVYPGGASGNPGSYYYDAYVDTWAAGEYYELVFLKEPVQDKTIQFTQTYTK